MRKSAPVALAGERRRLIARYQALKAARIPGSGEEAEETYRRQLVAFHAGVFHGLMTVARTAEDLKLAAEQLAILEKLVPYYDRPAGEGA